MCVFTLYLEFWAMKEGIVKVVVVSDCSVRNNPTFAVVLPSLLLENVKGTIDFLLFFFLSFLVLF